MNEKAEKPQGAKNPLEGAIDKLGVTDPKEVAVVNRLAGHYHRQNTLLVFNGAREELLENEAIIRALEGVLVDFGRADLVEGLKTPTIEDYAEARQRQQSP